MKERKETDRKEGKVREGVKDIIHMPHVFSPHNT